MLQIGEFCEGFYALNIVDTVWKPTFYLPKFYSPVNETLFSGDESLVLNWNFKVIPWVVGSKVCAGQ